MKIYIDLIIFINFFFDFMLLFFVSILLKRNINIKRLILSSLIGGISIISLFFSFNNFTLFLFKLFISIIMILVAFSYRNFKYTFDNFIYLYMVSIFLGGFLYFLNVSFSYKNIGLVFFHNGLSINFIFMIIISPIILYLYIRNNKKLKEEYSKKYNVSITFFNNRNVNLFGFLDTGNCLSDPFFKKPILIINKGIYSFSGNKILVPFNTINGDSIMECFIVDKVYISNRGFFNKVLVGISPEKFKISGVDIILNKNLWEDL